MNKITTDLRSIEEILGQKNQQYFIPGFQRNFVWDSTNVDDMFEDFKEDTSNYLKNIHNSSGYLLGSILVMGPSKYAQELKVVDGQQRLITITLIFKALSKKLKKINRIIASGRIHLLYEDVDNHEERINFKIDHDKDLSYKDTYNEILDDNIQPNENGRKTYYGSDNNLVKVWDAINTQLNSLNDNEIMNFADYLTTQVKIIETVSPSEQKAFKLFEVLNTRGKELDSIDLIKNLFLERLNDNDSRDEEIFKNYWGKFISLVQQSKKRNNNDPLHTFFRYFLMMKYNRDIKKKDFFNFFKVENEPGSKIESQNIVNFAKELLKYAGIYKNIMKNPRNIFPNVSNEMFGLISILENRQTIPLLMLAYDIKNINAQSKVVRACFRLIIASQYSDTIPNKLTKKIIDFIKIYKKERYDNSKSESEAVDKMVEINNSNGSVNSYIFSLRNRIKSTLSEEKISNAKAIKLLKIIELFVNKNQAITGANVSKGHRITLEHIIPQSYPNYKNYEKDKLGFNSKNDMSNGIDSIGNLTLLTSADNQSAGKELFDNKKPVYRISNFYITKAIVGEYKTTTKKGTNMNNEVTSALNYEKNYSDYTRWTSDLVYNRSVDIANLVYEFVINDKFMIS